MSELNTHIQDWIKGQPRWFSYSQMDKELNIKIAKDKTLRRVLIKRLVDKGILRRGPYKGVFRKA